MEQLMEKTYYFFKKEKIQIETRIFLFQFLIFRALCVNFTHTLLVTHLNKSNKPLGFLEF